MQNELGTIERRTTADAVFERLRDEIVSLELMPGTKLSELEVAKRFGVSRQPVRDAFSRLENMDLLLVRTQRATEVRAFSLEHIEHARFIRMAVELEIVRQACAVWDEARQSALQANLDLQRAAMDAGDLFEFHALDKEFHKLICELSGHPLAAQTIMEHKQKIDRLCMLSLRNHSEATSVFADHVALADALARRSVTDATAAIRKHLVRLDDTVSEIHRTHTSYFEM